MKCYLKPALKLVNILAAAAVGYAGYALYCAFDVSGRPMWMYPILLLMTVVPPLVLFFSHRLLGSGPHCRRLARICEPYEFLSNAASELLYCVPPVRRLPCPESSRVQGLLMALPALLTNFIVSVFQLTLSWESLASIIDNTILTVILYIVTGLAGYALTELIFRGSVAVVGKLFAHLK